MCWRASRALRPVWLSATVDASGGWLNPRDHMRGPHSVVRRADF